MSTEDNTSPVKPATGRNWALDRVGLPPVTRTPETTPAARALDAAPRPIVMIDVGDGNGSFGHPLLTGRARFAKRPPGAGEQLQGTHSAEVAGVIAQACTAEIIVYDIGTTAGWDKELFVIALKEIVEMRPEPAVINISVGWAESWPEAEEAIANCIGKEIAVVVAMGDDGALTDIDWYPATWPDVIAVAGTDTHDLRLPDSDSGDHVWIGAPGEDIVTVVSKNNLGTRNGTSFAAALVSAAVWLAKRANDALTVPEIREMLGKTADHQQVGAGAPKLPRKASPSGRWNPDVGCGRLDVPGLIEAATKKPHTPEITAAWAVYPSPTVGVTASAASLGAPDTHSTLA